MKTALNELLIRGEHYISGCSEEILRHKPSAEKWSKKEIVGHLTDSAINNLQRFTEIQFSEKPYQVRRYNQDELVKANDYQNADTRQLLDFWIAINNRIQDIMDLQTAHTLAYEVILPDGTPADLKFLMQDYVGHLEHHLNQIMNK